MPPIIRSNSLPKLNKRRLSFTILVSSGILLSFIIGLYFGDWSGIHESIVYRSSPFKVAATGDFGCGPNTDNTVANIKANNPGIILALGDLSYLGAEGYPGNKCSSNEEWVKTIDPIKKNLFFVVGNHDVTEKSLPKLLNSYLDYFGFCSHLSSKLVCREPYYSFNSNRVHFLIMNSEYGWKKGTAQYLFVNKDLDMASSDPDTDWIIVAFHSARYASIDGTLNITFDIGLRSSYPEVDEGVYYGLLSKEFADTYHPLFAKYQVDLILQGHVHNYQRSYPLKYDGDNKPPMPTSTEKQIYSNPGGQIYLTVGSGGTELHPVSETNFFISSTFSSGRQDIPLDNYYIAKSDGSHYGFLELQFSKERKALLGTFYGNDAIHKSVVIDQFTILK